MGCGFSSPEEIAVCIHIAQRWFQVAADIAGLGTFTLIALLIWLFERLRKDLTNWQDEAKREKELRHYADSVAKEAQHRAGLAASNEERVKIELAELQAVLATSDSDLSRKLSEAEVKLLDTEGKVKTALELTGGGSGRFWSRSVGCRFDDYDLKIGNSIPILLFGNQKGGVGKSTLVTNLAAAFAKRGEKILTIDLDYQGSHSSLAQAQQGRSDREPESLIDYLFQEELDPNWPKLAIRAVSDKLHYIPAFYNFELVERLVEYRWALSVTKDDVRYRLARALLSDAVQNKQNGYDRILIDAPPRFTLGFVNGICAATHLYVPTVVDQMSTSAVTAFARQFKELLPMANPRIRWSGIIGTMTSRSTTNPLQLPETLSRFADDAERAAQNRLNTQEPLFIRNPVIAQSASLARATETGIAYLNDSTVRPMFDALVDEIMKKAPLNGIRP